jgi:hypothetical protein
MERSTSAALGLKRLLKPEKTQNLYQAIGTIPALAVVLKPLKSDQCVVRPVRVRLLESVELIRTIQIRSDCELAPERGLGEVGFRGRSAS